MGTFRQYKANQCMLLSLHKTINTSMCEYVLQIQSDSGYL